MKIVEEKTYEVENNMLFNFLIQEMQITNTEIKKITEILGVTDHNQLIINGIQHKIVMLNEKVFDTFPKLEDKINLNNTLLNEIRFTMNHLESNICVTNTKLDNVLLYINNKFKDLSEQLDAAVGTIKECIRDKDFKGAIDEHLDFIKRTQSYAHDESKNEKKDDLHKRPYACPKCGGNHKIASATEEGRIFFFECPQCDGTGIIWK